MLYPTTPCRRKDMTVNHLCDPAGESPARPRLATSRNRVLRCPGVTPAAKRTQRACRPRDGAPKLAHGGADVVVNAEGTIGVPVVAWGAAVRRGRRAGHVRKGRPGTWDISSSPPLRGGAGAAIEMVQALGASPCSGGAKEGEAEVVPSEGDEARRDCCIARSFVTDFSVYFCSTEAGFFTLPRHRRRAERGRAPPPQ